MNSKFVVRACAGLSLAACTFATQLVAQGPPNAAGSLPRLLPMLPMEEKQYDLLLKGGHVIDPKNNVDAVRDVAIKDGKIAKVAVGIPANLGDQDSECDGSVCDAGTDRHARACVLGTDEGRLCRWRLGDHA